MIRNLKLSISILLITIAAVHTDPDCIDYSCKKCREKDYKGDIPKCQNTSCPVDKDCDEGCFGQNCEQDCSPCLTCDKTTGECKTCPNGQWGDKCQNECGEGWDSSAGNCDIKSGNCSKCLKGFYGEKCNPCPEACFNGCNETGCVDCFESEKYGEWCDKACPNNCIFDETMKRACDRVTGDCYTCNKYQKRFGKKCDQKCDDCQIS